MLIQLPDFDEPFCVTDHFCPDHQHNLSPNHYEIIKDLALTAFVLMDPASHQTLEQRHGIPRYGSLGEFNRLWDEWVEENFEGMVVKCNVTIDTGNGRYNGNYLYGFEKIEDALMFKLKWI